MDSGDQQGLKEWRFNSMKTVEDFFKEIEGSETLQNELN